MISSVHMAPQQGKTLLIQRGKERMGEPVFHVEGRYSSPQGSEGTYLFNVRRSLRNRLLGGSKNELADIRARIAALPGSPEGNITIEKGKAGPDETVVGGKEVRSKRFRNRVEQAAAEVRMVRDYAPTLQTAKSFSQEVRDTETAHHKTLVSRGKVFPVQMGYEAAAHRVIYGKRGEGMAKAVANSLVLNPDRALADATTYINQRYLGTQAQGERISRGEKFLRNRVVWGVLSAIPFLGQALTIWDDVNTFNDVRKHGPGTLRGKLIFQGGAALLSDISDIASGYLTATIGGIPVAEVLTQATNQILNPASIEHARLRIEDQRFMLQMQTAKSLLSPESGISDTKRAELAQAAIQQIGPFMDAVKQLASGPTDDPETYYATLMQTTYENAVSILSPIQNDTIVDESVTPE